MMENTCRISDNIKYIKEEVANACIKYGRRLNDVQIMAVSKTQTVQNMQIVYDNGINLFGENKVQELISKAEFFKLNNIECHMIGNLQSNKVKYLPPLTNNIQSVDSFKLASEISKQYLKSNSIANILLEINIGNELSKGGFDKENIFEEIYKIAQLENIHVNGLMCIPPICEGEQIRSFFSKMHNIFVDISSKKIDNVNMHTLSMGMTHDFELAIAEGSNMVRVGTGIFGHRQK